jgi:hypothetical protein
MALIEFKIDRDATGKTVIVSTVRRMDPGDEIVLITDTPGTALQWHVGSPFAEPAAGDVYPVPMSSDAAPPMLITKVIDMSQEVAQCGNGGGDVGFEAWPGGGGGFPSLGTTT